MTTTGERALFILPQLSAPLRDRVVADLIFARHLRLRLAGLDLANDLEFELAGECAPLDRGRPGGDRSLCCHR